MSKNLVKEVVWSKTKFYIRDAVGWMSGLVGGLQNHIPRFESGTDLILVLVDTWVRMNVGDYGRS